MTDEDIAIYHVLLLEWFNNNKRDFPWRYIFNPYKILISEILLQQTNAEKVIKPYKEITAKYNNILELSESDGLELKNIFKDIGLFYRANRLINISKEVMIKHSGMIPNDWDKLINIKGIGRYICSAVLCFGFNKPYAVLDTNVIRIFERIFDEKSAYTRAREDIRMWQFAQMLLPEYDYVDYNYALLDFAAEICKFSNPKCDKCSLRTICSYNSKLMLIKSLSGNKP